MNTEKYYDEFSKVYDTRRHYGYHALLDELEIEARDNFIENSDYIVGDFLDDEKAKEWRILFDKFLR